MKNYKYIIVILVMVFIITGCSIKDTKEKIKGKVKNIVEKVSLMEFDKYKDLSLDKVKSIKKTKLTVAGSETREITDKEEIKSIYNQLKNLKVGQEVTNSCEDNTTIYVFNMDDGSDINVEIECDWLVMGNKRYEIK